MDGRMRLLILTISLSLFLAGGLAACTPREDYPVIRLDRLEQRPAHSQTSDGVQPLRVAFASITSPQENITYYGDLLRYLEGKIGRPVRVVQRKTYGEANDLIRQGKVDLAFVCTYAYVTGHDEFGLPLLVVPQVRGSTTYQSYILVRAKSGIRSWEDLRGSRFVFTDPLSTTGYLFPVYLLRLAGERPERYFRETFFTYSHDNSIRAVQAGVADGAAVDSLVFELLAEREPALLEELLVIKKSPAFGIPPVVVAPKLDTATQEKLRQVFLAMDDDAEGRRVLRQLGVDRYVEGRDEDYELVRRLGKVVND